MQRILDQDEVARLLSWEELLLAMEKALQEFSTGRVVQPVRTLLSLNGAGWFGVMPCAYREAIGAKLVTVFPENAGRDVPTHQAVILLFSPDTGEPLCVMDGALITARRTAAVSALATRELSRPDSEVLAILGSGVQARTHFHALGMVRQFKEVRVWSRTAANAERFAAEIRARVMPIEKAVRDADVVVTVTNAAQPIVDGNWLKPGVHINAVGSVGPVARELDDTALRSAVVVVESRPAAERESAEIVQSGVRIYAELGEILAGLKPKPLGGNTLYKSLGIAVEDVAAAYLVYRKAAGSLQRPAEGGRGPV